MKITIYSTSDFLGSVIKSEATLIETGRKDYAQYTAAPFIVYRPNRKRTNYIKRATSYPYILVIEGHGHPEPAGMFGEAKTDENGTTIRQSLYRSFDDRYKTDFDAVINAYMNAKNIVPVVDIRETAKTNILTEVKN